MKLWEYAITIVVALVNLILVIMLITSAQDNQKLQQEMLTQQEVIQQGAAVQQRVQPVLMDMARVAVQNPRMRELLAGHGFRVNATEATESTPAEP